MASEISLSIQANLRNPSSGNDPALIDPFSFQKTLDQLARKADGGLRTIGTAEEVLTFTDIVTNGWLILFNLDPTNYIEHGPESAGVLVPYGKIKPGEPAIFRLTPGAVIRLKANTAACEIQFKHWND